jgi:hypothetical protein
MFGLVLGLGGTILGLVAVPVFGLGYMLGAELQPRSPKRIAPLRWRQLLNRSSLVTGLGYALLGGLFGGLVFGLAYGPAVGRLVGLVAGVAGGLAGILAAGLSRSAADETSPLTPPAS